MIISVWILNLDKRSHDSLCEEEKLAMNRKINGSEILIMLIQAADI